jgi:hypothetical protein
MVKTFITASMKYPSNYFHESKILLVFMLNLLGKFRMRIILHIQHGKHQTLDSGQNMSTQLFEQMREGVVSLQVYLTLCLEAPRKPSSMLWNGLRFSRGLLGR